MEEEKLRDENPAMLTLHIFNDFTDRMKDDIENELDIQNKKKRKDEVIGLI